MISSKDMQKYLRLAEHNAAAKCGQWPQGALIRIWIPLACPCAIYAWLSMHFCLHTCDYARFNKANCNLQHLLHLSH